jgi:hypothetical protein
MQALAAVLAVVAVAAIVWGAISRRRGRVLGELFD